MRKLLIIAIFVTLLLMTPLQASLSQSENEELTPKEEAEKYGIKVKTGEGAADISKLDSKIIKTFPVIKEVWKEMGITAWITSGSEGAHATTSYHYKFLAIDLRGKVFSDEDMMTVANKLQKRIHEKLGKGYKVIAEFYPKGREANDHIHLEYNGKTDSKEASILIYMDIYMTEINDENLEKLKGIDGLSIIGRDTLFVKAKSRSFSEYTKILSALSKLDCVKNTIGPPFFEKPDLSNGRTLLVSLLEGRRSPYEIWKSHEIEAGGIDFTSVHLAYISERSEEELGEPLLDFQYVLRATEAKPGDEISDLEEARVLSLTWFLIGLSLPDYKFWVNLNPWESDRIIDEDLGRTDVGRIMLEADFQMKKDFCKYQNPGESDIGEKYWSLLDGKREELVEKCMNMYPGEIDSVHNVLFAAATRHWIVPDTITGYGDGDEFYIADATLSIFSEPVFEHSTFEVVNQLGSISEDCSDCLSEATKEYGRYVKELEEEMILPLVVEEVNTNSSYSDLRQVYASLALAQWYKSRYRFGGHLFSDFIDSENLENLESKVTWSPEEIWTEYVKSYEEGEFHCEKEYKEGDYIITRIYTAGGVDFLNIMEEISIIGSINPEISETISETRSNPLVERNGRYYFGDYISSNYDLKGDTQSPIESIIEDYFEPTINTIKSIMEKYFVPIISAVIIVSVLVFVVAWSTRKKKANML